MVEGNARIVNPVLPHLDPHILDKDAGANGHILVAYAHEEHVETLMLALDEGLSKDKSPLRMTSSIGDPVLL